MIDPTFLFFILLLNYIIKTYKLGIPYIKVNNIQYHFLILSKPDISLWDSFYLRTESTLLMLEVSLLLLLFNPGVRLPNNFRTCSLFLGAWSFYLFILWFNLLRIRSLWGVSGILNYGPAILKGVLYISPQVISCPSSYGSGELCCGMGSSPSDLKGVTSYCFMRIYCLILERASSILQLL